jgi:predicted Rossmann fold flavoprotein
MNPHPESTPPILVVGAGAAGLMAAIFAARAGAGVLLLERTSGGGRKILISGGGRCNVLPRESDPGRFVTGSSPATLRRILVSWPLPLQRRFFEEEARIPLVEEAETGKLFPASGRAREVRDRLFAMAAGLGVRILFDSLVSSVEPPEGGGEWRVRLSRGELLSGRSLVLATGGLSVPSTGSDGLGMELARRLGHSLHAPYPALTPLVSEPHRHAALAGISLNVTLTAPVGRKKIAARGGFLFTHRGYSGPAVLDLSHVAVRSRLAGDAGQPILVQWTGLDAEAWERLLREERGRLESLIRRELPERLARVLISEAGIEPESSLSHLRREDRRRLVELLCRYPLPWSGDEGYRKAEVTGGGVPLEEIVPTTLESRIRSGLFLCGEILDAFGPIGGHNFAWAWATGRAAGLGAAARNGEEGSVDSGRTMLR